MDDIKILWWFGIKKNLWILRDYQCFLPRSAILVFVCFCFFLIHYFLVFQLFSFTVDLQGLKVIDLQQTDYMRTLESAIQFGMPVVLQNVQEKLDPSLDPVLNKSLMKVGQ